MLLVNQTCVARNRKVGNPLRDAGVGLKDTISLLEALVRGFSQACPLEPGAGGSEVVDAWRRCEASNVCFLSFTTVPVSGGFLSPILPDIVARVELAAVQHAGRSTTQRGLLVEPYFSRK